MSEHTSKDVEFNPGTAESSWSCAARPLCTHSLHDRGDLSLICLQATDPPIIFDTAKVRPSIVHKDWCWDKKDSISWLCAVFHVLCHAGRVTRNMNLATTAPYLGLLCHKQSMVSHLISVDGYAGALAGACRMM